MQFCSHAWSYVYAECFMRHASGTMPPAYCPRLQIWRSTLSLYADSMSSMTCACARPRSLQTKAFAAGSMKSYTGLISHQQYW